MEEGEGNVSNPKAIPNPCDEYSRNELLYIVNSIREILWLEEGEPEMYIPPLWNPDKEWDTDTLQSIADVMTELRPLEAEI
jgi:hypothetical protein